MDHLRCQRTHAGQGQRPPGFLGSRLGGRRTLFDRIGLHAQGFDGLDDRRSARQIVGHAEDAVDQVELQLLHTGQLAQLVLDQRLLGGAVHGFDAESAQPRVGAGRFGQRHQRRRSRAGTAGAAMIVLLHRLQFFAVIMIVIVLMLMRGVNGIAHCLASVKVPVAK